MKRLYEHNEIRHFFVWIALYLMVSLVAGNAGPGFGLTLNQASALPLAALAVVVFIYLQRTGIARQIGLGVPPAVPAARMWFYLPLLILVALPLLRGVRDDLTAVLLVAVLVHYLAVGFLEEVLCRGMLLRALLQEWRPVWAVLLSALTFGAGHAASLFLGQSGADTVLQIINATVVGLVFALVVVATGNLHAVIVTHFLYNTVAMLTYAQEGAALILAGTVVLLVYGAWLLTGGGALARLKAMEEGTGPPEPVFPAGPVGVMPARGKNAVEV